MKPWIKKQNLRMEHLISSCTSPDGFELNLQGENTSVLKLGVSLPNPLAPFSTHAPLVKGTLKWPSTSTPDPRQGKFFFKIIPCLFSWIPCGPSNGAGRLRSSYSSVLFPGKKIGNHGLRWLIDLIVAGGLPHITSLNLRGK